MNSRSSNLFRFSFAVFDLVCLNIVHSVLMLFMERIPVSRDYFILFIINNAAWIICAFALSLYVGKQKNHDYFFRKSITTFIIFFAVSLLAIFLYYFSYSRLYVILTYVGFGTLIVISRTLYSGAAYYIRRHYPTDKRVVIIGYNDLAKKLVDNFNKYDHSITTVGYFEDKNDNEASLDFPFLGKINDVVTYAIANNISEIYSTVSPERNLYLYDLAHDAETNFIRFKFVPDFKLFINRKVHIDFARNIPILSLRTEPLENLDSQIKKRAFDVVFSILLIFGLLSWLVPLMAIIIKLDSRGPVFFTQLRSGKNNLPFLCYKFRSLKVNQDANEKQVTRDDNRYTRIGRFLRKSNIDELPQFFNVFRGEMSVVGPRPHMLKHTEEYSQLLNHYMIRHYVKPGVTGWAQINGYRGEIKMTKDLHGRIEHDIWYMENWSMWLDFKIILLTIYNSIRGEENAF